MPDLREHQPRRPVPVARAKEEQGRMLSPNKNTGSNETRLPETEGRDTEETQATHTDVASHADNPAHDDVQVHDDPVHDDAKAKVTHKAVMGTAGKPVRLPVLLAAVAVSALALVAVTAHTSASLAAEVEVPPVSMPAEELSPLADIPDDELLEAYASAMIDESVAEVRGDDGQGETGDGTEAGDDTDGDGDVKGTDGDFLLSAESCYEDLPDDIQRNMYDLQHTYVADMAAGKRSQTQVSFQAYAFIGEENARYYSPGGLPSNDEIAEIFKRRLEGIGIFDAQSALIADHPELFYWMDKGLGCGYGFSLQLYPNEGYAELSVVTMQFSVAPEYRDPAYADDASEWRYRLLTPQGERVSAAVEKATEIAERHREKQPAERLSAYLREVDELVSYHDEAATWTQDDIKRLSSNPWWAISVFDGDPDTKVVCEGYAKAFKWLCDLSGRTDVECRVVTGYLNEAASANGHMWNVVRMYGRDSYLVDPTNCDEGTAGSPDYLFMKVPVENPSVISGGKTLSGYEGWYVFATRGSIASTGQENRTRFLYDDTTKRLNSEEFLTLSTKEYSDPATLDLSEGGEVVLSPAAITYGESLPKVASVSYYGLNLIAGVDYTTSFVDGDGSGLPGEHCVSVTGKGLYKGTRTGTPDSTYEVLRIPITIRGKDFVSEYGVDQRTYAVEYSPYNPNLQYLIHDSASRFSPVDRYSFIPFSPKNPYDDKNQEASKTAIDGSVGQYIVTFEPGWRTIKPAELDWMAHIEDIPDQQWTGEAIEPPLEVTLGGEPFRPDEHIKEPNGYLDYEITYEDNVDAGTATATISALSDNCTGSQSVTFNIVPAPVPVPTAAELTYDGSPQSGVAAPDGCGYSLSGDVTKTDAGTYVAVATVDANHVWDDGKGGNEREIEWTIEPLPVSVSVADIPDQQWAPGGVTPEPDVTTVPAGLAMEVSYEDNREVGTAKAIVTVKGLGSNYVADPVTRTFKVVPRPINISVGDATKSYGEADPEAYPVSIVYNGTEDMPSFAFFRQEGEVPGEYAVSARLSGKSAERYRVGTTINGTLTITRATAEVSIAEVAAQTYDGTAREPEPKVTTVPANLPVRVSYENNVNAGTDTAYVVVSIDEEATALYEGQAEATFTILPAPATISPVPVQKTYGEDDPELTATVEGLLGGDVIPYSLSRNPGSDAGAYPISVSYEPNPNYDVTVTAASLTIVPRQITLVLADVPDATYSGRRQTPTPEVSCPDADGMDITYVTAYGENLNAGTGTVLVSATGNFSGSASATFRILPRPATISADDKSRTMTQPDPPLTATVTGNVLGEELAYRLSREPGDSVGSYAIHVTAGDNPNYDVTTTDGTLRIVEQAATFRIAAIPDATYAAEPIEPAVSVTSVPAGATYAVRYSDNIEAGTATVTVTGVGSYAGEATATFRIRKAAATIEVSDATKVYGAGDPAFSATVKGVLGEDEIPYALSRTSGENAGTYRITAAVDAADVPNYEVSVKAGTLTITPAQATLSIAPIPQATYTGYAIRPAVAVATEPAGVTYALSWSGNVNAGTATVRATATGNHQGTATQTFVIGRASATIRANDQTKVQGAADPTLTATVTGALGSDRLAYTLSREPGEAVGSYAIRVTPGNNPNYDVRTQDGTFTVTRVRFRDVYSSTPHSSDIDWLAANGISTGWATGTGYYDFRPSQEIIRADMAAFLFRLAAKSGAVSADWQPSAADRSRFSDVNSSTPHAREIWWLASSGISTGWNLGGGRVEFRPYALIVRQDMAAFLHRLASVEGKSSASASVGSSDRSAFRDVSAATPHASDIWWLAKTGVSTGWQEGSGRTFRGEFTVLRQDMAAFLRRMDALS